MSTCAALTLLFTGLATAPAAHGSGAGYAANPNNPLAGVEWGVYTGSQDGVYPAYEAASGTQRALLAKVALQPRTRWFGAWIPTSDIRAKVHDHIAAMRADTGNPNVLVPMAMFRLFPGQEKNKDVPLTLAARQAYRNWVDAAARGIGSAHVLMILEPDLPVALKGWRPDVRLRLANYAARTFSALANTVVYLDGGASDWLTPAQATTMLRAAGVSHVRGFALSGTHYTATGDDIRHGRQIVADLAKAGIPGKHFVIDTSDNGRPFTYAQYFAKHPHGVFTNAEVCQTTSERQCVTLGIPPTWRVADPAWHLSATTADIAKRFVDGYVWYNRPWLVNCTWPFSLQRTLQMARTTPFQ